MSGKKHYNMKRHIIWSNLNLNVDDWVDAYKEHYRYLYEEEPPEEIDEHEVCLFMEETNSSYLFDEIINLSKEFETVLPCVDFSHIHARYNGFWNTYDEFCSIFVKIGKELGQVALDNFHAHVAGIEYSAKGEKKHLNLVESDFNYKDLLRAFKSFNIKGAVVCESPNIEEDAKLMKEYYLSL